MVTATPVVPKALPVLEPCDRVFDASAALAMAAPGPIADDAVSAEPGRHELANPAVAAVGQHSAVVAAQRLDEGSAVVHRVVAIAGTTPGDRDDAQVAAACKELEVHDQR
jgi:hypothetical protein